MVKNKQIFYLKLSVIFCVVILLVAYFFHQSQSYFFGPQIAVDYPINGESINNSYVSLKGQALNASSFLVDGRVVLTDTFGNFETGLLLAQGYNIIHLTARDKFGREVNKKLEVVLE